MFLNALSFIRERLDHTNWKICVHGLGSWVFCLHYCCMVCLGMSMTLLTVPCSFTFTQCTCMAQRSALCWEGSFKVSLYLESKTSTLDSQASTMSPFNPADSPQDQCALNLQVNGRPVCTCSFLLSHPILFISLFLSSYNRWLLSYFSCILKSFWTLTWTLNISPYF